MSNVKKLEENRSELGVQSEAIMKDRIKIIGVTNNKKRIKNDWMTKIV